MTWKGIASVYTSKSIETFCLVYSSTLTWYNWSHDMPTLWQSVKGNGRLSTVTVGLMNDERITLVLLDTRVDDVTHGIHTNQIWKTRNMQLQLEVGYAWIVTNCGRSRKASRCETISDETETICTRPRPTSDTET